MAIAMGPVTAYREITAGDSTIRTWTIFPQRAVAAPPVASPLAFGTPVELPATLTFAPPATPDQPHTVTLTALLRETKTRALIVVRDDRIVAERYGFGASRD